MLLLGLHGEISLSLLCSHSSWGSALVLAPPLCVDHPQASAQLLGFSFGFGPTSVCRSPSGICSRPDRRGLKQRLIRALLLTQVGGGRGTVVIIGMHGKHCNGEAETGVTLQRPEAHRVFSQGSCPCISGPWQWRAAQAPGVCG